MGRGLFWPDYFVAFKDVYSFRELYKIKRWCADVMVSRWKLTDIGVFFEKETSAKVCASNWRGEIIMVPVPEYLKDKVRRLRA